MVRFSTPTAGSLIIDSNDLMTKPKTDNSIRTRKRTAKGGRPTAIEAESRAAHLRDIATEVFLEFGYQGSSLGEIARRAGASKETLYSHYKNKADLFVAVMKSYADVVHGSLALLVEERRSVEETLKNFGFRVATAFLSEDVRVLMRVLLAESERFPEIGEKFLEIGPQRVRTELTQYLGRQVAQGTLRGATPELMAEQLTDLLYAAVIVKSLLGIEVLKTATQRRTHVDASVNLFLRSYGR